MSYNLLINNVIFGLTPNLTPLSDAVPQKTAFASSEKDSFLLANAGPVAFLGLSAVGILAWAVKRYGKGGLLALHYISKAQRLAQEADKFYHEIVHEKTPEAIKEGYYKEVVEKYTAAIESYAIAQLYHGRAVARAIDTKETNAEKRVRNVSSEEKRLAEEDLTKALEIYQTLKKPSNHIILSMARARVDRADILMSEGRLEEAVVDFRKAAELVKEKSMNRNFDIYEFYKNYEIGALIKIRRFQEAADEVSGLRNRDFAAGRIKEGAARIQELVGLLAEAGNFAAIIREADTGIELLIRLGSQEDAKILIHKTTEALSQLSRDRTIVPWLDGVSDIAANAEAYNLAAETCVDAAKLAEAGQQYLHAADLYERAVSHYGKLVVRIEWRSAHQRIVISTKYVYSQAELLVKASLALGMEAFALRAQNRNLDAEILFTRSRALRQTSIDLRSGIGNQKPMAVIFGSKGGALVVEPQTAMVIYQLRTSDPKTFESLSLLDQVRRANDLIRDFWGLSEADRAAFPLSGPDKIIPDAYIRARLSAETAGEPAKEGIADADRGDERERELGRKSGDSGSQRPGRAELHIVK
ncbi:MAG: hypothetical protein HYU98_00730 [Deltaproteobacteria bacterium]|nr:hypothetical protein [Deltaproteobacteria bacterium]